MVAQLGLLGWIDIQVIDLAQKEARIGKSRVEGVPRGGTHPVFVRIARGSLGNVEDSIGSIVADIGEAFKHQLSAELEVVIAFNPRQVGISGWFLIPKILEKAAIPAVEAPSISRDLLESDAERGLYAAMHAAAPRVKEQKRVGHFREALETIAALRPNIDKFFDEVMVMVEEEAVRRNRLALLSELLREFTTIADFSEMGSEGRS